MKICVFGLDCAAPEVVFADERLVNLRRLMAAGIYGRLESVIPPITVPAWMCMCTGQDPGSLGVYGFRNRVDHSYDKLGFANSASIKALAIWDHLGREGKRSIIVGVPPNYPPRRINGISVGCFLTPDTTKNDFTHPANIKAKINELVGEYPVDVKNFRTDHKDWLKDEIFSMSRKQWQVVHWLLKEQQWDYFHFVDIGLDRMHHGFWNYFDEKHVQFEAGNPFQNAIPEYYLWLDEQIGKALDLLDEKTIVLVVSDHGAQRLDGGIAVNEWLIREGLLVLNEYPNAVTPFDQLNVNWSKTRVWSEGGYYARAFFNMQGREPDGVILPSEYEAFQDQMKSKFEVLTDNQGRPLNSLVFKPKEIYQSVRNVAPDLIVHFGGLLWRSIGSVGHKTIHLHENDTGPDSCNHAQYGMFILTAPNCPLRGEYEGARLLDIAPTLLDLGGYEIPESMQGRSLMDRTAKREKEHI
ncbi:MAG TPA: alkaline phosphatase family protein [Terriglobales bacterium]|jgi:predicted AlkP superfamily phosphohydrolase/phosphomutase|nr:alkaline phosphatase family protein [Terriglobales bacterium]